ncbi:RNA-binding protein, putative [Perkinsus marinus ATCC 50983]|uniref:RNA-binding protein, putative n=1 Tax=Perkinsus marinus (strain ATCC 50983 / TXsc) TaxID=423536 RepID=C5KL69_PERM5|nr:RNA-binding protein, putative [Perkinsus marinus ATCC 50983]EER14742.1 RNA-binding protein, putative [Perkinsus marinus ATCC 50983]|eukprot:XP_002782946.1 RNA-binding protein, putative [Perkinsus marinus ATCC 50983]
MSPRPGQWERAGEKGENWYEDAAGDYQEEGSRNGGNVFHPEISREELAELHSVKVDCVGPETTEADVYGTFSRFGEVRDIYIPKEMDGVTNKPFCFVRYGSEEEAQKALTVRGVRLPGGHAEVRAQLSKKRSSDAGRRASSKLEDRSPVKARDNVQPYDGGRRPPKEGEEGKSELFSVKVSNLAADTAPAELVHIFSIYGLVREVYIPEGVYYGFVRFGREEEAVAALGADQTTSLRGAMRPIKVELSSRNRQHFKPLERRSYTATPFPQDEQQQQWQRERNNYGADTLPMSQPYPSSSKFPSTNPANPMPPRAQPSPSAPQQGRFSRPSYGDSRHPAEPGQASRNTSLAAAPAEGRVRGRPNPARVEDLPQLDRETRDRLVSVKIDGLDDPGKYRQEVYELFSEFGKVQEVYVPMARAYDHPHYMFVRYSTTEEAEASLTLNGRMVNGWPIRCGLAKRPLTSSTHGQSSVPGSSWSRRDPAPASGWTEQEQQRGWRVSNPARPSAPAESNSRGDAGYRTDKYYPPTGDQGPPSSAPNQQQNAHRPVLSAQDRERMFSVKVNNVGWETTEAEIEGIFSDYGYITEVYHPRDKPFAFVRFETEREAM